MGMKITGIAGVLAELRNIADLVPANARKTMHRQADKIVEEARLNTPVDTHNLEESIHKVVSYEGARGRLKIAIEAGGEVNGVNVDLYALKVHEAYETDVAVNGPGPGTKAKMLANPGRIIGSGFLTRAAESVESKLRPSMIQAIVRAIRGESV